MQTTSPQPCDTHMKIKMFNFNYILYNKVLRANDTYVLAAYLRDACIVVTQLRFRKNANATRRC